MKSISLLYYDWGIPGNGIEKLLCETFNMEPFAFMSKFREQMQLKDELTAEINSYLSDQQLVPLSFLDKFISIQFARISRPALLFEYPLTTGQYVNLEKILRLLNIPIREVWYIKQKEPETFLAAFFNDLAKKNDAWCPF